MHYSWDLLKNKVKLTDNIVNWISLLIKYITI